MSPDSLKTKRSVTDVCLLKIFTKIVHCSCMSFAPSSDCRAPWQPGNAAEWCANVGETKVPVVFQAHEGQRWVWNPNFTPGMFHYRTQRTYLTFQLQKFIIAWNWAAGQRSGLQACWCNRCILRFSIIPLKHEKHVCTEQLLLWYLCRYLCIAFSTDGACPDVPAASSTGRMLPLPQTHPHSPCVDGSDLRSVSTVPQSILNELLSARWSFNLFMWTAAGAALVSMTQSLLISCFPIV